MSSREPTTKDRVLKAEMRLKDLDEVVQDIRQDVDYMGGIGNTVKKLSDQMDRVVASTQATESDVRDLKTRIDTELPNLAKKSYLLEKFNEHLSVFHRRPSKGTPSGSSSHPCGYEVPTSIQLWLKVIIIAATAIGTGLAAWYGATVVM